MERGADKVTPMRINIIGTSPYQVRSISIDPSDGFPWRGMPRLLGIDDRFVYVMADEVNDRHTFIRVPVDGSPRIEEPHEFRSPGQCYFFDPLHPRMWYIDSDARALVEAELDGWSIHQIPLQLPEDLEVSQLHELVMADEGKIMFLSVDHRQAFSRFVFALGSKMEDSSEPELERWSMRWFRVKDLEGPTCISNCLSGLAYDTSGHARGTDAFYCLDRTGLLFTLDLEQVRNESGQLDDLDASVLLKPCGQVDTKGDNWLSGFELARTLPLAASYSMTTNSIQVWDLARKCRLYELECPHHIDAVFFLHEDRLLVTVERSMGIKHGTVAVTFLDYALLMGKPPVLFTAKDYVRLKPLLAVAPNDAELKILECLIRYFADTAAPGVLEDPVERKEE